MQIWKIEGREKILIPLDQFGFFHSSHCYLLQFSTKGKQHEVFLWVGSDVTHKVFLSDNTVCQDHLKGLDGGVLNVSLIAYISHIIVAEDASFSMHILTPISSLPYPHSHILSYLPIFFQCQMVIPEGREVERFLNIFKGKLIIQNTPKVHIH